MDAAALDSSTAEARICSTAGQSLKSAAALGGAAHGVSTGQSTGAGSAQGAGTDLQGAGSVQGAAPVAEPTQGPQYTMPAPNPTKTALGMTSGTQVSSTGNGAFMMPISAKAAGGTGFCLARDPEEGDSEAIFAITLTVDLTSVDTHRVIPVLRQCPAQTLIRRQSAGFTLSIKAQPADVQASSREAFSRVDLMVSCIQYCGAGQVTKVDPPQPQTSRPQGLPAPTKPEVQGAAGSLVATSNVRTHAPSLAGLEGSSILCGALVLCSQHWHVDAFEIVSDGF